MNLKIRNIERNNTGFTLVELLLVVSLGITLSVVGFTNYQGFRASKDVESTTNEVFSAIQSVRQRSITQEDGSAWGIRLNSLVDSQDNYEIYKGSTYSTSSVVSLGTLRGTAGFSEPVEGSSMDVIFSVITGRVSESKEVFISREFGTSDMGKITISNLGIITKSIISN